VVVSYARENRSLRVGESVLMSGKGRVSLLEIGNGYVVVCIRSGVLRPNGNDGGIGCGCGKAHVKV
jgi:hypothetical protein